MKRFFIDMDWSKYIERPYREVLVELKAEGYRVVDDCLIAGYRNTELQKDDINIQLVCVPVDMDDFEEKEKSEEEFSLDAVEWYVEDVFEDGESYQETQAET